MSRSDKNRRDSHLRMWVFFHEKESILIRKDYRKDEYVMEKTVVPTGDVVKDWDIREDEKI